MASVFLSYARDDIKVAEAVASALGRAGLSVWWDRRLPGGSEYSREIERALEKAHTVIVLWSQSSVDSPWVRDEAAKGRDAHKLVPATIDGTEPPLGFGQFHTIDVSRLRGNRKRGLSELIAAAKQNIAKRADAEETVEAGAATHVARRRFGRTAVVVSFAILAVIVAAAYLLVGFLPAQKESEARGGKVVIAGFKPLSSDPESERLARLAEGAVERTLSTNFIETASVRSAPDDAAREADFKLVGTVDRADDALSVLANVVDPETGRTLWSTEVSRIPGESRELAEELAVVLADVIRCSTYTKRLMPNYSSAEVYSRIFRSCEAERSVGQQYDQLPVVSQALVEVAPESAQAWAYLANTTAFVYGQERRQQVLAAAQKALELDPDNGAVRWGLAILPGTGVPLARREQLLLEGLRLDPNFLWFRNHLGHIMRQVGRTGAALDWYQEFLRNYPIDNTVRPHAAYLLAQTGDMRRAREEFEHNAQVRPDARGSQLFAIRAEIFFGDPEAAQRLIASNTLRDNDRRCAEMTIAALRSKRTPGVDEIERLCVGGVLHPEQLLAKFGHKEEAFEYVSRAGPFPIATMGPSYLYEPHFASLRADPRFIPLLVKWGIPQYWLETNKWPDFCREEKLPYDCREAATTAVAAARR